MARVDLHEVWVVGIDPQTVENKLFSFVHEHGMTVEKHLSGQFFWVKQGSQIKTRLLGGMFVKPEVLPKKAIIQLSQTANGVQLDVKIEESMGFGSIMGMKQRYQDYFSYWMAALKQILPQ